MLARRYRFIGRDALKPTMRHGQKLRGEGFTLRYRPATTDCSRFAVVVSKKVHKRAVVRNRIRRRIYSFCEQYTACTPATDVVLIVYDRDLADISRDQLDTQLTAVIGDIFDC